MALPTVIVEAAFGDTMFTASPSWTDISDYVRGFTVTRGRPSVDARFQTGTATVTLDNRDGRFTPDNTAGAYYADVVVGVPVRIRATEAMTTYPVFYGSARAWPPETIPGGDSTVDVPLADGFYTLNQETLAGNTYSEEATDTRFTNVLDDLGWPAGLRDFDTALASVQGTTFASPGDGGEHPALRHLLDCAEAEAGLLFMSREGNVEFQNRVAQSGASASVTFTGADFTEIKLSYDDSYLWNNFRISREDGLEIDLDVSSGAPKRTLTRDVMPMANDAQVYNLALWLDFLFSSQRLRIDRLRFEPLKSANAEMANLLNLELRDYINVEHTPPGGDAIDQDVAVEGIRHVVRAGTWTTWLDLVPLAAVELQDFWILGTSQLDTTTILA